MPPVPAVSRRAWRWLVAAALLVQLVVLYWPRALGPEGAHPGLDKLVHAGVFGAVALAGVRAGGRWWLVGLLCALHAPLSEVLQHTVLPDRDGDALDAAADLLGTVLGTAAGVLLGRRGGGRAPG